MTEGTFNKFSNKSPQLFLLCQFLAFELGCEGAFGEFDVANSDKHEAPKEVKTEDDHQTDNLELNSSKVLVVEFRNSKIAQILISESYYHIPDKTRTLDEGSGARPRKHQQDVKDNLDIGGAAKISSEFCQIHNKVAKVMNQKNRDSNAITVEVITVEHDSNCCQVMKSELDPLSMSEIED